MLSRCAAVRCVADCVADRRETAKLYLEEVFFESFLGQSCESFRVKRVVNFGCPDGKGMFPRRSASKFLAQTIPASSLAHRLEGEEVTWSENEVSVQNLVGKVEISLVAPILEGAQSKEGAPLRIGGKRRGGIRQRTALVDNFCESPLNGL